MTTFDPEDYGLQPIQESVPRNWRRDLEARVKAAEDRAAAAEAELATRDRDQAFAAAGVPNEGIYAMARQAYQGPLEPEAIRAAFGVSGQVASTQQSLAGHMQAQAMAAGAPAAVTSSTAAEFAALRASARTKRNGGNFGADRAKLGELLTKEGVEPNPTQWQLPKQLVQ